MPNHVRNNVYMRNIGKRDDLYTEYADGRKEFDFNKITPMPEELDIPASSFTDAAIDFAMMKILEFISKKAILAPQTYANAYNMIKSGPAFAIWRDSYSDEELCKEGIKYVSNVMKYGYPTWYEWCINRWGTKWNAYDTTILNNDAVEFNTAWNIPYCIYEELSKMNPYDIIKVDWFDEGGVCGRREYLDGEIIEDKVYTVDFGDYDPDHPKLFSKVTPKTRMEE